MSLEDAIRKFPEQFAWEPQVVNEDALVFRKHIVVCGMGGSQLASLLLQAYGPKPELIVHRDYGLPELPEGIAEQALFIMSSYSGTTEETLDSAKEALARGYSMAAVSTGGALINFAKAHGLPHVVIPETGLEPRLATGYSLMALARLIGDTPLATRITSAGRAVDPIAAKETAQPVFEALKNKVPLIYASTWNAPVAYIWKIKFNESSKIPAFCDLMPEMCHNELCGMDVADSTRALSFNMHAIFLTDGADHLRNSHRMKIAAELLQARGILSTAVPLVGEGFGKALAAGLVADWISLYLAQHYGVPDQATPLIAEFKRRMAA